MTSKNLVTAKEGVTLKEAKAILAKARVEKLPIVDDDFNLKDLSPLRILKSGSNILCLQKMPRDVCYVVQLSVSQPMF